MKHIAIAATATVAILTIAGLTGTSAARAQIAQAVRAAEHPAAAFHDALARIPSQSLRICIEQAVAQDILTDANGRPIYAPQAIRAQSCR